MRFWCRPHQPTTSLFSTIRAWNFIAISMRTNDLVVFIWCTLYTRIALCIWASNSSYVRAHSDGVGFYFKLCSNLWSSYAKIPSNHTRKTCGWGSAVKTCGWGINHEFTCIKKVARNVHVFISIRSIKKFPHKNTTLHKFQRNKVDC